MKTLLPMFLSVILILSVSVSFATHNDPSSPCESFGDVNGDGVVNTADVNDTQKHIVNSVPITDQDALDRADVNGDGNVDVVDSITMLQYIEGKINNFPVCYLDDPVLGNRDAPVEMIWYTDLQGPFDAMFHRNTLPQIKEDYIDTGKVKIIAKDFPLDFHANALKAAEAASCAHRQNLYWEYQAVLFENQGVWEDETNPSEEFATLFKNMGGGSTLPFNACLSFPDSFEIEQDIQEGKDQDVIGAPTFFINGHRIDGAQSFEEFERVIEEALGGESINILRNSDFSIGKIVREEKLGYIFQDKDTSFWELSGYNPSNEWYVQKILVDRGDGSGKGALDISKEDEGITGNRIGEMNQTPNYDISQCSSVTLEADVLINHTKDSGFTLAGPLSFSLGMKNRPSDVLYVYPEGDPRSDSDTRNSIEVPMKEWTHISSDFTFLKDKGDILERFIMRSRVQELDIQITEVKLLCASALEVGTEDNFMLIPGFANSGDTIEVENDEYLIGNVVKITAVHKHYLTRNPSNENVWRHNYTYSGPGKVLISSTAKDAGGVFPLDFYNFEKQDCVFRNPNEQTCYNTYVIDFTPAKKGDYGVSYGSSSVSFFVTSAKNLVVDSMATYDYGERKYLRVVIQNNGTQTITEDTHMRIDIDGKKYREPLLRFNLKPGQKRTKWIFINSNRFGERYMVTLDSKNVLDEISEIDNQNTIIDPVYPSGKKDLVVTNMEIRDLTVNGRNYGEYLKVTVKNIGEESVSKRFYTRVEIDGRLYRQYLTKLSSSQERTMTYFIPSHAPGTNYKVIVDATNIIDESNENNNEKSI